MHRKPLSFFLICLALTLGSGGCTTVEPSPTPEQFPTAVLAPYLQPTATQAAAAPTDFLAVPVTPAPSPTPFTHMVAQNETMLGIAYRYGISLEELQAANPGVDAQFMAIGTVLIIPLGGEIPQTLPTPTPIPLAQPATTCYRTADGGAWCFVLVANDQAAALENISAWVGLYDEGGNLLAGQVAVSPLNRLAPGSALPLVVFFPPPLGTFTNVRSQLLTALVVSDGETRYLAAAAEVDEVQVSSSGLEAAVRGRVSLPEGAVAQQVWLMMVAYAEDGQVVGVRKVEMAAAGEFDQTVYSLGPVIARVEVLVEARPAPGSQVTAAAPE